MSRPARFPRALFFDLDGTLLAPGSVLTDTTAHAVRAASARGAVVVLATGGFSERALALAGALRVPGTPGVWAATHNGAAIWSPERELAHHLMTPPAAMRRLLRAAGPRVWCVYESLGGAGQTSIHYLGRERLDLAHFVWGASCARDDAPPAWQRASRSGNSVDEGILGCWCIGTPAALAPLDQLAETGALSGTRYLHWSQRLAQILGRPRLLAVGRDVGPIAANKGYAARWLCQALGIAPEETAAFGDASNDVEVLGFAGTAVAMRNATPDVLACADMIAPPCTQDGVAQVLSSWLDLPD